MTKRSGQPSGPHRSERQAAIARIEAVMRDRQHERERAFAAELEAWKDKHADPSASEPSSAAPNATR